MTIVGQVTKFEPLIPLTLGRPDGSFFTINAVVDSGYTGFLTLPFFLFEQVATEPAIKGDVKFADQRTGMHDMTMVMVHWDRKQRLIPAVKLGSDPLAGMSLFEGHRITIEDVKGGRVLIEPFSDDTDT